MSSTAATAICSMGCWIVVSRGVMSRPMLIPSKPQMAMSSGTRMPCRVSSERTWIGDEVVPSEVGVDSVVGQQYVDGNCNGNGVVGAHFAEGRVGDLDPDGRRLVKERGAVHLRGRETLGRPGEQDPSPSDGPEVAGDHAGASVCFRPAERRPSKAMSKAFNGGFQRIGRQVLSLPAGGGLHQCGGNAPSLASAFHCIVYMFRSASWIRRRTPHGRGTTYETADSGASRRPSTAKHFRSDQMRWIIPGFILACIVCPSVLSFATSNLSLTIAATAVLFIAGWIIDLFGRTRGTSHGGTPHQRLISPGVAVTCTCTSRRCR